MVALDLRTRFASLLDDQVARVAFKDGFDSRVLVPRYNDEAGDVRRDPVVLSRWQLDRLDALICRALAMEWEHLLDAMLFCAFLNPLVDRTKDFLVTRGRVREIHRHILPPFAPPRQGSRPRGLTNRGRGTRFEMSLLLVDDRDGRIVAEVQTEEDAQDMLEAWATDAGSIPDYLWLVEVPSHYGAIFCTDISVNKIRPMLK